MQKIVLLIAVIFLSACCGIPQKAKLPLPDEPVFPVLTNEELSCVSQTTYDKITSLHLVCIESIRTHRDVIKSTH